MGTQILKQNLISLRSKMLPGQQGKTTRLMKWPAVAVVAVASSFYTIDYTKNWWNNFADSFGLTLNALDNSGLPNDGGSRPWWKKILGKYQKQEEPSLPPDAMHEILVKNEFKKTIGNGIVARLESNQIHANFPIEDRNIECFFPNTDSYFFGVFDGHSGYHCSQSLKDRLPQYVSLAMSKAHRKCTDFSTNSKQKLYEVIGKDDYGLPPVSLPSNLEKMQNQLGTGASCFSRFLMSEDCTIKSPEELIKLAFLTLDKDICTEAIPDRTADETLLTGLSGSCAITSCINGDNLYIANTGDCRAVIGKRSTSGKWIASQITQDQTVENVSEVNRIESEHPNEKTAIQHGRLLGQLQPLRAFGDVQYKWSRELHDRVISVVYGRPAVPLNRYLTPPYLTAEPVVSHRKITKEDKFLILATDGLWEKISSEYAVKIIGCILDAAEQDSTHKENGASKLIRYALGKGSDAYLANMLTLPQHLKRHFHDDITVTIVYFDNYKTSSKL